VGCELPLAARWVLRFGYTVLIRGAGLPYGSFARRIAADSEPLRVGRQYCSAMALRLVAGLAHASASKREHTSASRDISSIFWVSFAAVICLASYAPTGAAQAVQGAQEAVNDCLAESADGNCPNSQYGPISTWDTSQVSNMDGFFLNKISFVSGVGAWDVSNVCCFQHTFQSAEVFNEDLSAWDMSSATHLAYMFYRAYAFNGDVSTWQLSNIQGFSAMFAETSFNGDLSAWATPTSDVSGMFYQSAMATDMRAPIGPWDVSNINSANMYDDSCLVNPERCNPPEALLLTSADALSLLDRPSCFLLGRPCASTVNVGLPWTEVDSYAFSNKGLTGVIIEAGVTYIGRHSFSVNPNLATVTIGPDVVTIFVDAFKDCYDLSGK